MKYQFRLNGSPVVVDSWDPGQPLLYVLRNSLNVHGPKFGCGLGQCGACSVLVDGNLTRSCMTEVSGISGKNVTTVEGFGTPLKPDSVQEAFIAEQAAQCGYCTAGMVTAARALLARNAHPSVVDIRQALAGNLCRCGTHTRIVNAVLRAANSGTQRG